MYFPLLRVLVGLAFLAVVSASKPTDAEQPLHNATSDAWSILPSNLSIPVEHVQLAFSPNEVYRMHQSLNHAKSGNLNTYGSEQQQQWISLASDRWSEIDGSTLKDEINRHPHFNASVTVDDQTSHHHFMGLFSKQPDAIPIVFLHGWPGSFLDFLDLLDVVRLQYTPEDSPFHLIVPSLPGYAFSSGSPMGRHTNLTTVARTVDALLTGVGLDNGYIAQGSGVGSYIARLLGSYSPNCEGTSISIEAVLAL
jgi:microsomal epoxide hydrolase